MEFLKRTKMIKYILNISMIAGLLIALPLLAETREHALVVNEEWVYITEKNRSSGLLLTAVCLGLRWNSTKATKQSFMLAIR